MGQQLNGRIYLQKLQTVAYLCIGIPLLFFIYAYLESSVDQLEEIIPSNYHLYILFPLILICLIINYWSIKKYKFLINQSFSKLALREKLALYQEGNNNRFIMYGISAMMISIGFYLTNFQPFAALFGIIVVLFSINNPNARKIVTELKLRNKDKEIIYNGLEIP